MLSDKLKENYIASQNIELRTKALSFRNLSRASKSEDTEKGLLDKISAYVKKQSSSEKREIKNNDEITIVENPNEPEFVFPDLSDIAPENVLPFFKSVGYKLTKIYG